MTNPIIAEVTRGGIVESRHTGSFAVVDGAGKLIKSAGDFAVPIFPRSASLPAQAVLMGIFSIVFGLLIARYRIRLRRESPLWLLALNVSMGLGVTLPLFVYHRHSSTRAACTVVLLLGGLVLYVGKIPERFASLRHGALDLIGNSHQIWHAMYCLSFYTFFSTS